VDSEPTRNFLLWYSRACKRANFANLILGYLAVAMLFSMTVSTFRVCVLAICLRITKV